MVVSTGLLSCRPKRLPPGCTAEKRFAVESARPGGWPDAPEFDVESRVSELAVFAFCAEITRLAGHCAARSDPENATAHTTPSRSTMVAHMWLFRPLFSSAVALSSAAFSVPCVGNAEQPAPAGCA